jgi:hypothetical protein
MQSALIDHLSELQRLEHQLRLARRAVALITDPATVKRVEEFSGEISRRLRRLKRESREHETRRHAYELWERADGQTVEMPSSGYARNAKCWTKQSLGVAKVERARPAGPIEPSVNGTRATARRRSSCSPEMRKGRNVGAKAWDDAGGPSRFLILAGEKDHDICNDGQHPSSS